MLVKYLYKLVGKQVRELVGKQLYKWVGKQVGELVVSSYVSELVSK